jgi:hypothetical protein
VVAVKLCLFLVFVLALYAAGTTYALMGFNCY